MWSCKCRASSTNLAELPLFLQHSRDILPPSRLPLLGEEATYAGLRYCFLTLQFLYAAQTLAMYAVPGAWSSTLRCV